MFKLTLVIFFLWATSLLGKEVSVFNAGNINNNESYGLNSIEKAIIFNKKKVLNAESSLEELSRIISGIETTVYNDSKSIHLMNRSIDRLKTIVDNLDDTFKTLKFSVKQNEKLLDNLSNKFVTKKEYNKFLDYIEKISKNKIKNTKKLSGKAKFSRAIALYQKKKYTRAISEFRELIKIKHRPARANYYIAQSFFKTKKYANAVKYYKISILLYDKANYIPKLILNSAISFEHLGEYKNAKMFYNTLISSHKNSSEAKVARIKIKKLK